MRVALYYLLLLIVVAIAFWRGRQDERVAASVCVVATFLTVLFSGPLAERWADFNVVVFIVDVGVFLTFLAIALRSQRFWPLWVAGFQLTATTVHLLKIVNPDMIQFVFGAALAFWSYPILALIGIGAWRTTLVEGWRSGTIA